MALQVVSPAVSVYQVTGVVDGVEQTKEYTFKRGELLPDWVTPYQQFTLTQTGMARQVGDFPDPALVRAENPPGPVLMPEHDPRTVLGTNVTGPMVVVERVTGQDAAEAAGPPPATGDVPDLPDDSANKPEWEEVATRLGMKRTEAESMRKDDLKKEVVRRHRAAVREQDKGQADPPASSTFAPQTPQTQPAGASSRAGGDATSGENAAKGGTTGKA